MFAAGYRESVFPAIAAGHDRRVLQRSGHHASRLGRHYAAGHGR